jgi:hypothetical protein
MQVKKTNALVILALSLFSSISIADGTGKIYKSEPVPKNAEVIRENKIPGALYPFPSWNDWDGLDRPKYWNGYGVDPSGVNYYHYFDQYPCQYEFAKEAKLCKILEESEEPKADVPEPSVLMYLVAGLAVFLKRK